MPNTYQVGDRIVLRGTFTASDVPTNPTAVTLSIQAPDGTITSPAPTNVSAGLYEYDLDVDQSGAWRYRFAGTGAVVAASRDAVLIVSPTVFA
jgi:hypothetical protein